ncbi:MAG: ABC transporter ATP-binding protein, partial [Gammaproteobacteria bacterium]|nr:ABC transporter ATP-binding protein [Gammaproteobacteria bacterium]
MTDAYSPPDQERELTRREREAELDARSSGLDTRTDITAAESLAIIFRSTGYIRYFPYRYVTKFILKLGSYILPLTFLAWPAKILVDHVVLGMPVADAVGYPGYMHWLLSFFEDKSVLEILLWLALIGITLVLTIGSYTTGFEDETDAGLAQGHDYATQVENKMHGGHSTAGGIYGYIEFKLNTRLTQVLNHTLRAHLFSKIAALSITKLEDQRIGDSIYRVMYDTPQINEIFYEMTHTPGMSIFLYFYSVFIMLNAYPHLPIIAYGTIALFPLWVFISAFFSRIVRRRGQAARAAGSITTATIEEGMDNVLAVQSLGGNAGEQKRFSKDSKESFFRHRAVTILWIFIINLGGILTTLAHVGMTAYVAHLVIQGVMSPGDVAAIAIYFGYLRGPAFALGWLWIRFQDNVVAMRRVFAMMDLPAEDQMGTLSLDTVQEGVEMVDVGLTYPDGRRALKGVNLSAKVGEIVAIVGPTGSGKTSLAYLIPRYHMATEGEITIDGVNINDVELDELRSQITYVFQETQLFSSSILDNIRYGREDALMEEVEHVAKVAGIHDFIQALPEGYDTKLGTTTAKISVGQKQRISIARGLLRESKILILDEPTSALDPETEKYLVESLHEAAK